MSATVRLVILDIEGVITRAGGSHEPWPFEYIVALRNLIGHTPLAVVLTELLQNVVEHAYPMGRVTKPGQVLVELGRDGATVRVRVVDDGVGVPSGFSIDRAAGLGLTIVRTFVESDLGGTIEMRPRAGASGTYCELLVPVTGE